MSKKVLLITHYYYPNTTAGAHRPAKLVKYLPKFGWTPTVVCADWNAENSRGCYDPVLTDADKLCEIIRVPFHLPRSRSLKSVLTHLETAIWPYLSPRQYTHTLMLAAERQIRKERFDVIWSTYKPGLNHYVASKLAQKYHIPWVADFRDLPDLVNLPDDSWRLRRCLRTEMSVCSNADALVGVTPKLVEMLQTRHKTPVHLIYNGFDPNDYMPLKAHESDKFLIVYSGIIYNHRNPQHFFTALDLLRERGQVDMNDFSVQFYGPPHNQIDDLLKGFHCSDIVECCDRLPHREIMLLQQKAVILLLLQSAGSAGSIPMKFFVYLGARRPILSVPGDCNLVDAILKETEAGVSVSKPVLIAKVLENWYKEWKRTGTVVCKSIPKMVACYSREEQARQLAEMFNTVSG